MNLLYTAAHSGFDSSKVPLGGAAAICRHLSDEWEKTRPFPFEILGPAILGRQAPVQKDLVRFTELEYARFCRAFEKELTARILTASPAQSVVLSNDISEGPDFQTLARAGFRLYTIFHVDVVDYLSRIYLRSLLPPEWLTRPYDFLERHALAGLVPDVVKLAVQKQRDCVLHSSGLIVPSQAMKHVLLHCYPDLSDAKVHVLPWGIWEMANDAEGIASEKNRLQQEWGLPADSRVLLTLSRISPEKGQDRLLKALRIWERSADYPKEGVCLVIAGEAAYMQGRRFEAKLRRLASRLRHTRVIFSGYAAGARKQALFELAELYVFPSRHESYGLTLLEAMRAGLPALACDDHGTRDLMHPEVGRILPAAPEREIPNLMKAALADLLRDRNRLKAMGEAAQHRALSQKFSATAVRLAELLKS